MNVNMSNGLLATANDSKVFFPGIKSELKVGCEIVRKEFLEIKLNSTTIENSYFHDSYFKNTHFDKVNLDYTDFENIIFEGCTFENCTFGSDIRSCVFLETAFLNTKIDESYVDGCVFRYCILKNSSIDITSITNCVFDNCELDNVYLKTASLYHNTFKTCKWVNLDWSFATVFYLVLVDCQFQNITLALPTLDYIFGLEKENLEGILLKEFRRKEGKCLRSPLIAWKSYENLRSRIVSILTKGYCFKDSSIIHILRTFFLSLPQKSNNCPYISRDEILFLQDILNVLDEKDDLPMLALFIVTDWAFKAIKLITSIGTPADLYIQPAMIQLYTRFHQIFQEKLFHYERQRLLVENFSEDQEVTAKFTFKDKPKLSPTKLFNSLADISGMDISTKTQFVSSKEGSYVETIRTTRLTLFAVQTFLYLLNGRMIIFTGHNKGFKLSNKKFIEKYSHELTIAGKQILPSPLQKILKCILERSSELEMIKNSDFFGYRKVNIVSVDIV